MLTKQKLRKWLNVGLLVATVACAVVVVLSGLSTEAKAVLVAGYAAALKAVLPTLKKQAQDAIDGADLPEDEPKPEEAAK